MQSLRTRANSSDTMYLIPPQARFDVCWLVKDAKSPLSITATLAPRAARDAAETAPLIPPPTIRTSKTVAPRWATLALRRGEDTREPPPSVLRVRPDDGDLAGHGGARDDLGGH